MNEIKVSVIIPVYNSELYLAQCLDTLMAQTMKEFEVICVDDGSTDSSAAMLDEYARKDSRITVVHQPNSGAAVARNLGFTMAKAEYVMFLDADDFYEPELLEHTYIKAKVFGNVDIVLFAAKKYDNRANEYINDTIYLKTNLIPYPEKPVFNRTDIPDSITFLTNAAPWVKLYRAGFIKENNLQFQNLANSNDLYFGIVSLACADRITCVLETLVSHRVNNPLSAQGQRTKNCLCFISALEKAYDELVRRGIYDDIRLSFIQSALNSASKALEIEKNPVCIGMILERLVSERFARLGVIRDDPSYYGSFSYCYKIAKSIINAASFHKSIVQSNARSGLVAIKPVNDRLSPCLSVILPVVGAHKHLAECLDSLCAQTLSGVEIIVISDGRDPNTERLLSKYAFANANFAYYKQDDCGIANAKNTGFSLARSKYIYFMDPDSVLEERAMETLCDKANKDDLDIVFFDSDTISENSAIKSPRYSRHMAYTDIKSGANALCRMQLNNDFFYSSSLYIIKADTIKETGLSYIQRTVDDDIAFTFEAFLKSKRVSHIYKRLVHLHDTSSAVQPTPDSFSCCFSLFTSYLDMMSSFGSVKNDLSEDERFAAMNIAESVLTSARNIYIQLSETDKAAELGCGELYPLFIDLIREAVNDIHVTDRTSSSSIGIKTVSRSGSKLNRYYSELRKVGDENKESIAFVVSGNEGKRYYELIDPSGNKNWVTPDELSKHAKSPVNKVSFEIDQPDGHESVELRKAGAKNDESVGFVVDNSGARSFYRLINPDGSKNWVDRNELNDVLEDTRGRVTFELLNDGESSKVELRSTGEDGSQGVSFVIDSPSGRQYYRLIAPDGSKTWVDEKDYDQFVRTVKSLLAFSLEGKNGPIIAELRKSGGVGDESISFVVDDAQSKHFFHLINSDGSKNWVTPDEFSKHANAPIDKLSFAASSPEDHNTIELRRSGPSENEKISFVVDDGNDKHYHHLINSDGSRNWITPEEFSEHANMPTEKLLFALNSSGGHSTIELRRSGAGDNENISFVVDDGKNRHFHRLINSDGTKNWIAPDEFSSQSERTDARVKALQDTIDKQYHLLTTQDEHIKSLETALNAAVNKLSRYEAGFSSLSKLWVIRYAQKVSRLFRKLVYRRS